MNETLRMGPSGPEVQPFVETSLLMPPVERTLKPPFPIETVLFDSLASFNPAYDPDYVYQKAMQNGGTDLTPTTLADQLINSFITQSHQYDVPYERWMRTRYALGIQTPFTGFEPDALSSNQKGSQFVQETGKSYLNELRRMDWRFQRDVFETISTEQLHVGALIWLNERYAAQRAICRARAHRCEPLQEYRSELDRSISSAISYSEKEDTKGDKIVNPSSYTITLPAISTRIRHVFDIQDTSDIEKPAGFAARVGIIGNPAIRTLIKLIPDLDYRRIRDQSYRCRNY